MKIQSKTQLWSIFTLNIYSLSLKNVSDDCSLSLKNVFHDASLSMSKEQVGLLQHWWRQNGFFSVERPHCFYQGNEFMKLRLANGQKAVNRVIPAMLFYPTLYLYKDYSLHLRRFGNKSLHDNSCGVWVISWKSSVISAITESFPPSLKPTRRVESEWKLYFPRDSVKFSCSTVGKFSISVDDFL